MVPEKPKRKLLSIPKPVELEEEVGFIESKYTSDEAFLDDVAREFIEDESF